MAFTPKEWKDLPDQTTPLSGLAIKDIEARLSAYTDARETAIHTSVSSEIDGDVATHAALKTGVHGIPNMTTGNGVIWDGTGWVDTNLATQAELDAEASTRAAADTALDGRLTTAEGNIAALTPFLWASKASQSTTTSTWTIAALDTTVESQNITGFLTLTTGAPQCITVNAAGTYAVSCEAVWQSNGTGDRLLMLGKNPSATAIVAGSATQNRQQRVGVATTNINVLSTGKTFKCASGDKIFVQTWQSSTTTITCSVQLEVARIGP